MSEFNPCKSALEMLRSLHEKKAKEMEKHQVFVDKYYECSFPSEYSDHQMRIKSQKYIIEQIDKDIARQSDLTFMVCGGRNEVKLEIQNNSLPEKQ